MSTNGINRRQFISRGAKGGLALVAAGSIAGLSPEPAFAGAGDENVAMFTNFGSAPHASAHLDVGISTDLAPAGSDVLFSVFDSEGLSLAEFTVKTNANGFASSASAMGLNRNLFRLTNGGPGLVRSQVPGAVATTAVLYQRGQGSRLVIGVPSTRRRDGSQLAVGQFFLVAIGDVATAAFLIGNVSGGDVAVDVFVGENGVPGAGKFNIPRIKTMGHSRIDLQPDDVNSLHLVKASGDVVVQLMIDDGRVNGVTCLPG